MFFKPRQKSPNRIGGGISDSMLNFPDKKIKGLDALLVQVLRVSAAAVSFRRIKPVESPILLLWRSWDKRCFCYDKYYKKTVRWSSWYFFGT
jgi:hypothetical protein